MKIAIIDNYDSFTFNLYQLVAQLSCGEVKIEVEINVYRNDRITIRELSALKPNRIILSPGPGHPCNERDFGICKDIIFQHELFSCPVLGVCLGHQGIVHHLGGTVVPAPQIMHGKTSRIRVAEPSILFEGIPREFEAMRYHSLIASPKLFPQQLKVTAYETEHGLIMALQHKTFPVYGVQFHPESIGTPAGKRIMRNFLENNDAYC